MSKTECPREHEGLERLVMDPFQGKQTWMGQDVAFLAHVIQDLKARVDRWEPKTSTEGGDSDA